MSSLPAGWFRPGPVNGQKTLNRTSPYRDNRCGNSDTLSDSSSGYFSNHIRTGAEKCSTGCREERTCYRPGHTTGCFAVGRFSRSCTFGNDTDNDCVRDHDRYYGNLDVSIHKCGRCSGFCKLSGIQEPDAWRWSCKSESTRPATTSIRAGYKRGHDPTRQRSVSDGELWQCGR